MEAIDNERGFEKCGFEIGDVVELKSGGPPMTFVGLDDGEPPRLICQFFDETELISKGFVPQAVTMFSKLAVSSKQVSG